MKKTTLRLGVALTGSASALAFASPAFADCDLTTPDTYTCVATTTTDTTLAVTPSVDRHAVLTVGAVTTPVQLVINGAVDGYGLAFTQGDTATNGIVVTNNGSIAVNAGNTATAGGSNGALAIVSNGTPISYSGTGTISNLGIGDALQINASGSAVAVPITVNAGGLITAAAGNGATLNATSAGSTINATFNGINAGSVGIAAQTSDGALTLNTGAIQAAGAAVTANSTTGTITTNVTGNVASTGAPAAALLLTSTSGPINVNVTGGNVTNATSTAISADTAAAATVNVSSGRTVSGATAIAAPNAAGSLTVVNNGTLTGTTAAVNSAAVTSLTNSATGTINGPLLLSAFNDTVTNNGTLALTGTSNLGDGNDTITNNSTFTLASGATLNLGLGNDVITNAGTFTVNGTLNTGDGNDTVNNSGTYTVSGTQDFGIGTDAVNNTGTFNVTGAGNLANLESFNNSAAGVVNFASGSTLTAGAATTFTNAGRFNAEAGPVNIVTPTFTNAATGIIDMQDGANGDVTTITGNYVGTAGSRVLIDANADLTASDRLVVSGNISGTSTLGVAYLGTAATFNPTGALVVDGAGTTAAGSFILDPASVTNGLLTYALDQRGSDYYLSSNFNAGVTGLAPLARMGSDMWYQSFDAYHDGIAGRHGVRQNDNTPFGVWGNMYWSRDKWGDVAATSTLFGQNLSYSSEVENHRRGAQGGVDIGFGGFTVGITGGYEHNKANNGTFADYDVEGYNYGAYALFGSEAGIYGGVMYKRDNYDVRFADNVRAFQQEFNNAHSDGWDGELGFRTGGETVKFDLNAGLSWVKTKIDPVTLYGSTFSYDGAESMRGRLGARIILPQTLGAFVGVKAFHEFKKDNEALFITSGTTTGALLPDPRGTTIRVEGGLGGDAKGGPLLTVWGDFGDSKGLGVRAGFRF